MEQIRLASSGRETTRLGYGCSSIMGALGRRQSLRLLEAAYDAGIRHFDVAPMYGYGEAESCLGEFRARHNDITITTKYGIAPPKRGGMLRAARRIVGPVLQRVPALKRRLVRAAGAVAAPAEKSRFSADEARASLENSLRALRTNFIDIWLLHEAEASDLTDDALLNFLHEAVAQKKIGSFGVGSDSAKLPALLRERPAYCQVVQHDWSVLDPLEPARRRLPHPSPRVDRSLARSPQQSGRRSRTLQPLVRDHGPRFSAARTARSAYAEGSAGSVSGHDSPRVLEESGAHQRECPCSRRRESRSTGSASL